MNFRQPKKYTMFEKRYMSKHINEGRVFNVSKDSELQTNEVSNIIPKNVKVEKDDKQSFEDYKKLYNDVITQKCIEDYGTSIDKQLWEDTAKEMFLKSKEYIPTEGNKTQGTLDKKEENKNLKESKFTVNVTTPFGDLSIEQTATTQEEANKLALQKIKAAFTEKYQNKVSLKEDKKLPDIKYTPRTGDVKNYGKINIYVDGEYFYSTNAYKTIKDAIANAKETYPEIRNRKIVGERAK